MNILQYDNKGRISLLLKLLLASAIIFITIYLGNESLKYFYKIKHLEAGLEKKVAQKEQLEKTLKEKEKELEMLNSDWGKEEYLRKTYNVATREEKVIVIVNSTNTNDFEIIKDVSGGENSWSDFYLKLQYYLKRYINL